MIPSDRRVKVLVLHTESGLAFKKGETGNTQGNVSLSHF